MGGGAGGRGLFTDEHHAATCSPKSWRDIKHTAQEVGRISFRSIKEIRSENILNERSTTPTSKQITRCTLNG